MKTGVKIIALMAAIMALFGCARVAKNMPSSEESTPISEAEYDSDIAERSFPDYWYDNMEEAFNFDWRHFHTTQGQDDYTTNIDFYTNENDYLVNIEVSGNTLKLLQVDTTAYLYTSLDNTWIKFVGVNPDGYVDMLGMGDTTDYEEQISNFEYIHTDGNCDYFTGTYGSDTYTFCLNRSLLMCTSVETPMSTIDIDLDMVQFMIPTDNIISRTITDTDEIISTYESAMIAVMCSSVPGELEAIPVEGYANEG